MVERNTQSPSPNVVATFDSQDDADEAILELRLAGFRDRQIGYFARTPAGEVTDLLERNFWIAGATIGAIAGVLVGIWLARVLPSWESPYVRRLDAFGLMITCATFACLFLSCIGGMIGAGIRRRWLPAPVMGPEAAPFIVAVSAGSDRDLAVAALNRRGGYDLRVFEVAGTAYDSTHTIPHPV